MPFSARERAMRPVDQASWRQPSRSNGDFTRASWCVTSRWFERLVTENPYPEVTGEPTKLHAYVLEREPSAAETARLSKKCTGPERFEIKGDVLYLHAPDGLGKSVFAGLIARTLKVPGTARNWRTVLTLLEMMRKA